MANLTDVLIVYNPSFRTYRERYVSMDVKDLFDDDIKSIYRFSGSQISFIARNLEPSINSNFQNETFRCKRLTIEEHLVIALQFYAHGSTLRNLSEQYASDPCEEL